MTPMALTLKGFRGIRDGLGRDELTLDFARLAADAPLIAIVGANGRGKTTVIDNMTPYPVMASRAGDGVGGFSYYDQVYLPENLKDLEWTHGGQRYRSQIVVRVNGKKKTEAYLHTWSEGGWRAVTLADGTVSDGKLDTYLRCVEAILGSAPTFFTSMFAAQGRRQLSAYRNAEIKTLLADLLGLDDIRALGAKAGETARLLKAGLAAVRQEASVLDEDTAQVADEIARLGDTRQRITAAQNRRVQCQRAVDAAKDALAGARAQQQAATQMVARRAELQRERRAIIDDGAAVLASLERQEQREVERLDLLDRRIAQRVAEQERQRASLLLQRNRTAEVLRSAEKIARAARRLPLAEKLADARRAGVQWLRGKADALRQLRGDELRAREKIVAIEQAAGQAALAAQALARRFALTAQVPCAGSALQGQCPLLGDAHDAKRLMPSAQVQVRRLEEERRQWMRRLTDCRAQIVPLAAAPARLALADNKYQRADARSRALALLAARQDEVQRARDALAALDAQIRALPCDAREPTREEQAERTAIAAVRQQLAVQRAAHQQRTRAALQRVDSALAQLPAAGNAFQVMQAQQTHDSMLRAFEEADRACMAALRDHQRLEDLVGRQEGLGQRRTQMERRCAHIEQALGGWTLFARCMSNDGLIALSIDDAGPTLARLTNDLLLACYGPRFAVSIRTQVDSSKGELREGFDIVVHDADTGASKSVTAMSGGERVWINESLTRAIALYLAQDAGRRYETLFSDEADGPLDPARKRMFVAMKREVLRIGGYRREYFVSQTPELAAMADAVIDLDQYQLTGGSSVDAPAQCGPYAV